VLHARNDFLGATYLVSRMWPCLLSYGDGLLLVLAATIASNVADLRNRRHVLDSDHTRAMKSVCTPPHTERGFTTSEAGGCR
jgi:hypothetical protein